MIIQEGDIILRELAALDLGKRLIEVLHQEAAVLYSTKDKSMPVAADHQKIAEYLEDQILGILEGSGSRTLEKPEGSEYR